MNQTFPRIAVYSGKKSAFETFSESLRMEMYRFGVKVSTVRLGDFARLTNIMQKHSQVMTEQEGEMDDERKKLYGDYFKQVHSATLSNYGYFSPTSFVNSNLFQEFDKVVYAVEPPKTVTPAKFTYKILLTILTFLPVTFREFLIVKLSNILIKP